MASCKLESVLKVNRFRYLDRTNFEIVITRFNEPLFWTDGMEHLCTVYNKGDDFHLGKGAKVISVPNYGVRAETILRHIISRYNSLPEVTFFSQANLCDNTYQPLYPLTYYYTKCRVNGVFGYEELLEDPPESRFQWRISSISCKSVGDKTFAEWRRDVAGISYRQSQEGWVKGDWISVGRERIQKRPLAYYKKLYDACQFSRGILVEECCFLERTFYSMFGGTV